MGKSVHIRNRNGRLYLETYLHGKQMRRALGLRLTGDKQQDKQVLRLAEIIRSRREMQLACIEWGIPDSLSSEKLLPAFIEENWSRSKNYTLGRCLHYVRLYRYGNVQLGQITPRWVEDFQAWLLEKTGLSQGSASLYASTLRRQLRLAVRDKLLPASPADFVKNIPMPESKKQPLSEPELIRLANVPITGKLGREIRRAFLFACFTGLRVSDLKSLRWDMVHRHADGTYWLSKQQKKTCTTVDIPLCKTAVSLIDITESKKQGLIFPLLAATHTNTDQYLRKWGLKIGIPHVSWHTARHTMATIALEHGAELRTVSELLGHTNITTTLRYAKATNTLKKAAVDALPALDICVSMQQKHKN